MEINIFKTIKELLLAMANYFVSTAQSSISIRGECNIVLSGGSSPKLLYEMLASPDFKHRLDWERVNFFFGDERFVPADDPQNNALMVKNALFDPLNISASRIFVIDTSLSPQEAAGRYTSTVTDHFKARKVRFDLILLGLGDNSHTASLFPYTPVLADKSASIKEVYLEQQNIYRITMTAPLINQARHIAFLVYGEAKADAVHHVLENERNENKYPAQLIQPENGDLKWYIDEAAASRLNREFRDTHINGYK
jgi:6-phosphogluconolactonase